VASWQTLGKRNLEGCLKSDLPLPRRTAAISPQFPHEPDYLLDVSLAATELGPDASTAEAGMQSLEIDLPCPIASGEAGSRCS